MEGLKVKMKMNYVILRREKSIVGAKGAQG
jgi:hypothetical protein